VAQNGTIQATGDGSRFWILERRRTQGVFLHRSSVEGSFEGLQGGKGQLSTSKHPLQGAAASRGASP